MKLNLLRQTGDARSVSLHISGQDILFVSHHRIIYTFNVTQE